MKCINELTLFERQKQAIPSLVANNAAALGLPMMMAGSPKKTTIPRSTSLLNDKPAKKTVGRKRGGRPMGGG